MWSKKKEAFKLLKYPRCYERASLVSIVWTLFYLQFFSEYLTEIAVEPIHFK
jgi:hypothetical protein